MHPIKTNFDFNDLYGKNTFNAHPLGWKPLVIEYGYSIINGVNTFVWKIKNTTHIFRISIATLNEISTGEYVEYVEKALEEFRKKYFTMAQTGFKEEWEKRYHEDFKQLIEL